MACTTTSGTSMISRVRPNSDRGMNRLMKWPNGRRACISSTRLQDVAAAAHGVEEAWLPRVGLDLAAQANDLDVDGAFAGIVHAEGLGDVFARQHLIRFARQRGQQCGF